MRIVSTGIVDKFCQLIGIEILTADGVTIAFLVAGVIVLAVTVTLLVCLFKWLCYLRK